MSRVSILEQLYTKRKSALEFNYDNLVAPPIRLLLSQQDINRLYEIATSLRYNGNIKKKYKLMDEVMNARGFRRAFAGTNRVVYNYLEDQTFVAKVAVDKVGMKDSPAEFTNQEFFKPFCCKIFEVDPTGVVAFVERVNPITSIEEFMSVSDDIFNMMITKIIGKYVVDDLGCNKYMNYGLRQSSNGYTFGPVILDFPYAYKLDGNKLICNKKIDTPHGSIPCGGEIDYDDGFNNIICTRCGKTYQARELAASIENKDLEIIFSKGEIIMSRVRIVNGLGEVVMEPTPSTKNYISKEQYHAFNKSIPVGDVEVTNTIRKRHKSARVIREEYYDSLSRAHYGQALQDARKNITTKLGDIINPTEVTVTNTVKAKYTSISPDIMEVEEPVKGEYGEMQVDMIIDSEGTIHAITEETDEEEYVEDTNDGNAEESCNDNMDYIESDSIIDTDNSSECDDRDSESSDEAVESDEENVEPDEETESELIAKAYDEFIDSYYDSENDEQQEQDVDDSEDTQDEVVDDTTEEETEFEEDQQVEDPIGIVRFKTQLDEEVDYSNYVPDEEENPSNDEYEEDEDVQQYDSWEKNNRYNKNQKKKVKNNNRSNRYDDMSDY